MNRTVFINRDSVCAGDDIDCHEIPYEISNDTTLINLLEDILKSNYLAHIYGGKATWVFKYNNELLAVVAQEWDEPKLLTAHDVKIVDLIGNSKKSVLHFEYLAQANPDQVFNNLSYVKKSRVTFLKRIRTYLGR